MRRQLVVLVLALLAASPPLAASQSAQGQESFGITPASLAIESAQRGEAYQRLVVVQNEFDTPTLVTLETSGPAADWVSTQPASGFEVPARAHVELKVTVRVPTDAENGAHAAQLRAVAEPKDQPEGSGFALRYAVGIPIDVDVGGEQVLRIEWSHADAPDVEVDTPPRVLVQLANVGNVRTTARALVDVMPFSRDEVIATARGELTLIPGAAGALEVVLDEPLPLGQYRASVRSDPSGLFEEVVEFKVLAPGSLQKSGELRYLAHEAWVEAGRPVKISGVFENTGSALLGRVKLTTEVYLDGRLVEVITSDPLVVAPGERVNLTAFFTPEVGGRYELVGHATYDGFEAMPSEGILNVIAHDATPSGTVSGNGWLALALAMALGGVFVHYWLGRRG